MSEHDKTGAVETESLMPKYTVTDVETQAIQYYNKTYPVYGSSGKYIIYQGETTVMDNICHVMLRFQQGSSISDPVADVYMNLYTGECKVFTRTVINPKPQPDKPPRNRPGIWLSVIVLLMWLFAPFLTVSDKHWIPAFAIVVAGFGIEELLGSELFWIALGLGICIIVCLVSFCRRSDGQAKVFSLIGTFIMCPSVFKLIEYSAEYSDYGADILGEVFGFGFLVIPILMLCIFFVSITPKE